MALANTGEWWVSLPQFVAWLRTSFATIPVCEECENRGRIPCDFCRGVRIVGCACDCGALKHEAPCPVCLGTGGLNCDECGGSMPLVQLAIVLGAPINRDIALRALADQTGILARLRPTRRALVIRGRGWEISIPTIDRGAVKVIEERAWAHEQVPLPLRDVSRRNAG